MSDRNLLRLALLGSCASIGFFLLADDAEGKVRSTYATCYSLQGRTASGHYVNRRTAAHNFLWPGTKIRLIGRNAGPNGVRRYIIRDTGPALSDGHLDLWAPSGCIRYGKKSVRFKIGWRR